MAAHSDPASYGQSQQNQKLLCFIFSPFIPLRSAGRLVPVFTRGKERTDKNLWDASEC